MKTRTIEISDETYEKIKEQLVDENVVDINCYEDFIGKNVFVRTVTYHLVGKVVKIVGKFVFLKRALWIADSGRFMQFVKEGKIKEYEEVGDWFFNLDTVVDGCEWKHNLPKGQK